MNELDLRVSRKLQKIMRKLNDLVEKEIGEPMGLGLVVFPWANQKSGLKEGEISRFQYISTVPRHHMHGALRALVTKWDASAIDIAPHKEN